MNTDKQLQATYDFIIKDLNNTLESHDDYTLKAMLINYYNQWLLEPASQPDDYFSFTYDYVYSYPMIPYETYAIEQHLVSIEATSMKDYLENVSLVIEDIIKGNEHLYKQDKPTEKERFNYMMLSRLQQDCEYFLGNGDRNAKQLWALNVKDHIKEMKKIHDGFEDNKKPEWLTYNEILEYEKRMQNN